MKNKIHTNGQGSFIQQIIIKVDLTHVETAKNELQQDVFKTDGSHAYFKIYRKDRKRGNDEMIVYDLWDMFSFDRKYWSIDWDNSIY